MKKLFALLVLVAFVGVVAAPAVTIEKNSSVVVIDQSFDKNIDKDKDKDKKKTKATKKAVTKTEVKSTQAGSCTGCTEKSTCEEGTAKKESSCCGEKTEAKKVEGKKTL